MSEEKKKKGKSFMLIADGGGGSVLPPKDPVPTTTVPITDTAGVIVLDGVVTNTTRGEIPSATDPSSASKSALGEIIEAFGEISTAFNSLGGAFTDLGSTIQIQSTNIGNQMNTSVANIRAALENLVSKFTAMGINLSNNLKP